MRYFITGTSGFVGFHLARRLLSEGHAVAGYDGMTPYYDVALKRRRRTALLGQPGFASIEAMLEDDAALCAAIASAQPDIIVHLAAQAGVRYGLENPAAYRDANLVGTFNLLEAARRTPPRHLLFASSSSLYGGNELLPFSECHRTDFPLSLYAATKKAGEAMSHAYAHLHAIPTTCFRFFTVYGPWGRPDMALYKFVDAIEAGYPIDVYGQGQMRRDFTYIADLIDAIIRLTEVVPRAGDRCSDQDSISPSAPWRSVNIGGGNPVELLTFIAAVERALGKTAARNFLPMQPGDVRQTFADTTLIEALIGPMQHTSLESGIADFIDWYRAR